MKKTNITLVGFMGTGKTSAACEVAAQLNTMLVDMDDLIESRAGKPISKIFEEDGEPYFRQLEADLSIELSKNENQVIAGGGGLVLNPANIEALSSTGIVICLSADPQVILERVSKSSNRPLLEDGDKAQKILDLLASRKDLYASIPHQINTTTLSTEEVSQQILELAKTT